MLLNRIVRFFSLLLLLAIILCPSIPTRAQTDAGENIHSQKSSNTVNIEGTISSINNKLIELLNGRFVIDASGYTQELGSSITVGMFIKVEANPPQDQNGPF